VRILVLGSGAREHAIVMALLRDSVDHEIIAAPGNAGTAGIAENVALDPSNPSVVAKFAADQEVDLVVVGPEAPLVAGVADRLRKEGIPVFGPNKAAAALEGSKSFAKFIMSRANVPTGAWEQVSNADELERALDTVGSPYVVKADGLAAGKGVLVTEDRDAAVAHASHYLQDGTVLLEEYLAGPEVSLFFLSDGKRVVPLSPAQDYKRARDGDEGPNTGGMGAYSPVPWLPENFIDDVTKTIAQPTVDEMAANNTPFVGLLYCGLVMTDEGVKVIEFNARFGDPETQSVLARLESDLAPLLLAAATESLDADTEVTFSDNAAITVVLASEGYPENPQTGRVLTGLAEAEEIDGVHIAHAATAQTATGLIATGGRVLSVVAVAKTFTEARTAAYQALEKISLDGSHYRTDIGAIAAS
jgi:phosphoribosylamine---glycine ligase